MRHSKFTSSKYYESASFLIRQTYLTFLIIMSSANCPFSIFPKKEDSDTLQRKDKYVSINIPLDPNNPNSQKITHKYQKLNLTDVEDILLAPLTTLLTLWHYQEVVSASN